MSWREVEAVARAICAAARDDNLDNYAYWIEEARAAIRALDAERKGTKKTKKEPKR